MLQYSINAPFSRYVNFKKLSKASSNRVKGKLSSSERIALSHALETKSVSDLNFDFRINPIDDDGWILSGSLSGLIIQTCVVSLEDVKSRVRVKIYRKFIRQTKTQQLETKLSEASDFEIDPLEDIINLGDIILEELILELPNYPKRSGVGLKSNFADKVDKQANQKIEESPFSVLKKLKQKSIT